MWKTFPWEENSTEPSASPDVASASPDVPRPKLVCQALFCQSWLPRQAEASGAVTQSCEGAAATEAGDRLGDFAQPGTWRPPPPAPDFKEEVQCVRQDVSPARLSLRVVCDAVRLSLWGRAEEVGDAKNMAHLRDKAASGEQNQPNRKGPWDSISSGSSITPCTLDAGHRIYCLLWWIWGSPLSKPSFLPPRPYRFLPFQIRMFTLRCRIGNG